VKQQEKCGAVCGSSLVCQRESGHTGKHREEGSTWTSAGAQRVKEEAEARLQKEAK